MINYYDYDLIFVGGGVSVIFGLSFLPNSSWIRKAKVLIIEAGPDISERNSSNAFHRVYGLGGAGAFSDFKLDLGDLVGYDDSKLIPFSREAWSNFIKLDGCKLGEDTYPKDLLDKLISQRIYPLKISWAHFGSKQGAVLVTRAVEELKSGFRNLEIWTNSTVCDVEILKNSFKVILEDKREVYGRNVIIAVGRSGYGLTQSLIKKYKTRIKYKPNNTDIGVRIEFPQFLSEPYREVFYDPKLIYYSSEFEDRIRVFCANLFEGEVVEERYIGKWKYTTVNGHSDPASKQTGLSNFAILASYKFDDSIRDVNEWTASIVKMANNLTGGKILVQRVKDLKSGRKSTIEKLSKIPFSPSLATAYPGDLSLVLPYRVMSGILEFIDRLDSSLFCGLNEIGILYGIEAKFYGYKVLDSEPGLYFVGDCSGQTRSILGATAHMLKTLTEISSDY